MHQQVSALVATALGQSKLSGLAEMLQSIAEALNSYGAILWQVAPGSRPAARRGSLQVLAEWFPEGQSSALYRLPIRGSLTGEAIVTQRAQTEDITSPRVYDDPFFAQVGIRTFCALPLRFTDKSRGTVNIYRNTPDPFTESELEVGGRLAALVPELYQAIQDKVGFHLIHEVHEKLHEAELSSPDQPLSLDETRQVIHTICTLVGETFQCLETSVFLEDKLTSPGSFELAATTWPIPFAKRAYCRDPDDGLTGWVLAHGQSVRIPNLFSFEQDQPILQSEYPGLSWNDSLDLAASVRSLSPDIARDWLPLSFLAVPIVRGDWVQGAIRCSVAQRSPYSFAAHEESLLTLVAAQIGRSWSSWLNRRQIEEENRTWKALVGSIQELNRFVLSELSKSEPDERLIFGEALRVTSSMIAGAEIMDVRLLDEANPELYFAVTHGAAWDEGEPQILEKRRRRRFPVGDPEQKSAGAHVVETGEVYVIPDVSQDAYYSETFPKTKLMIVAPMVSVAKDEQGLRPKVLGVLDIRVTEPWEFPRHAREIAGLLGSQLGLYHDLATTIGRLRRMQREQSQTFQDLKHQIKTPIDQAHKRVGRLLKDPTLDEELRSKLSPVRGLVGKALRVSMKTGLFATLAKEEPLNPNLSALTADDLSKLLIEAGMDNRLMSEPSLRLNFRVEKAGLERLIALTADRDLLEQAVSDLLDNAFKYSYRDTVIRILSGVTGTGRFHITVINKGVPIAAHEVPLCVERGWQSEAAQSISGAGSGIGLWIVRHIMRAHRGELQILPTKSNDETEIKLFFPKDSVSQKGRP